MPIGSYFKGSGEKVLRKMKKHYGPKKGKEVFHATAKKMKMTPEMKKSTKASPAMDMGEMSSGYRTLERCEGMAGMPTKRGGGY